MHTATKVYCNYALEGLPIRGAALWVKSTNPSILQLTENKSLYNFVEMDCQINIDLRILQAPPMHGGNFSKYSRSLFYNYILLIYISI